MCIIVVGLIVGQGGPGARGGPGGFRPLRFQSSAFLAGRYIAVKTAKQLHQQTLEAPGREADLWRGNTSRSIALSLLLTSSLYRSLSLGFNSRLWLIVRHLVVIGVG